MNNSGSQKDRLLEVKNLRVVYGQGKHALTAVKGISFHIKKRATLGLVGESGCGKSSTGLAIVRLVNPSAGKIIWRGKNLSLLSNRAFRKYRRQIQIIFQNPESSLNPRLPVTKSLQEALALGRPKDKKQWDDILCEKLELVGLNPSFRNRYPHEFSGGQLQRIGIARALCVEPRLIICDEPVSSLDVSIQAQILNLLIDLQERFGLSYLFISHDLAVVRYISQDVAVMHRGSIREFGSADDIFLSPKNRYTISLISAVPG